MQRPDEAPPPAKSDDATVHGEGSRRDSSPGRILRAAGLLVAVAAIGWLDLITGPRIGFSLFYLVPVVFAGWRLGRLPAALVALASAAAWLGADLHWQQSADWAISAWNGLTRLGIFVAIGQLTARVRSDQARTEALLREATHLARTDALTGLANSRRFFELLGESLRSPAPASRISLIYGDVDNFKRINDREGHQRGDDVLRAVAACLQRHADGGVAARIGGDEFALLFFDRDPPDVERIADRLVGETEGVGRSHEGSALGLSLGIVHASPPIDPDELMRLADERMYEVKAARKGSAA